LNIETKTKRGEKRLEKMKLNTCSNNNLKPRSITRKEVLHAATAISSPKASHQEALHVATAISSPQCISSGSTTCSGGNLKTPSIIRKTDWTMNSTTNTHLYLFFAMFMLQRIACPLPPLRFPLQKCATKKICFCKRKGSAIRMHNN
jgi:hypothetical protein